MKRANNLYDKIYDLKNIHLAFYKASKGKTNKNEIIEFSKDLDKNIKNIQNQLCEKKYVIGNYKYFVINDTKERTICAASFPERVIHHALMNITDKYFENFQINDSYACRRGKGVHLAVKKAFNVCKKYSYFLKLDIRKYFDSIDHNILLKLLERRFKDKEILKLFFTIIDSYHKEKDKGIPIGNLTSQYFANYYLGYLDRFIKECLKIKDYYRYMDDFILFFNYKEELLDILRKIKEYLKLNLDLEIKPPIINKIDNGFPFLGCKIFKNKIFLSARSKKRFKDKLIKYENWYVNGYRNINRLSEHINSLIEFTKLSNARNLRNMIIKKFGVISM